ncbi:MAG: hypothetical protein GQ582_03505 [Methyloprofundus sp.]|nr:hypothetical protein [Methyloprofundus sp.]
MPSSIKPLENNNALLAFALWSVICLLLFIVYWPSLHGPLVFDDIQNIVKNPFVAINDLSFASLEKAASSNNSGLFKRVLPALSFGVNHYMAGGFTATLAFKLTNLLVHIINSGLVMCLVFLLWPRFKFPQVFSKTQSMALFLIVLLWALHPLHVSTVAYVVQRMTSMAASFVLLGLCLFVYGRNILPQKMTRGFVYMAMGVILGTLLGLLSKENAALVSCYAAVIEFSLYSRQALNKGQRRGLYAFYSFFVLIPICLVLFYYFVSPGNLMASFGLRDFSLGERLWTESRVLWFYLSLLVYPDITTMGLFHDDIVISREWMQPISTLVSVLSWLLMLIAAFVLRHKLPVFTFAVLWFLLGHSMESSFLPLELVYEHRNYLPSLGIIILGVYLLMQAASAFLNQSRLSHYIGIAMTGLLVLSVLLITWTRATYWESEKNLFTSIGENHPDSAISQYLYAEVLFKTEKKPLQAYPHYFRAAELNPVEVSYLIMAVLTAPVDVIKGLQPPELKQKFSNAHIVDLILHKSLSPWSLTIFEAAGQCVISRHAHCLVHIPDVMVWLEAVMVSPYVNQRYKRKYRQQLYAVQMMGGQYEAALKTILAAIAADGRAFQYYLKQANTLQALGRYREALTLLKEAERGVRGRRADLLQQVQSMQRQILVKYNVQQKKQQR